MLKPATIFILALSIQLTGWSQTSRSVCAVTINEKPYILSPEKDTLTRDEIVKAGRLLTPGGKYTVISFQVVFRRRNDFGFIIFGSNLLTHYYSDSFLNLKPGDQVLVECVQVKDKNGQKQVLENRLFYVKAGPQEVKTNSSK